MDLYQYRIDVKRVVDGDTVDAMVDLGFRTWTDNRLRLYGIDTPESRTRDDAERAAGKAATAALSGVLDDAKEEGRSVLMKSHGLDKYGRSLATLFVERDDGSYLNVNDWLLENGYAKPYFGGAR